MRVALIHDWLTGLRGGERCLQAFLSIYPKADIFTLFHVPGKTSPEIDERVHTVSALNKLPFVRRYYRALLPFFPKAIRQFDLSSYDLVISLSHAAAKNVIVGKNTTHICYCFTPMRYIWDQAEAYLGRFKNIAWPLIEYLRRWDLEGATRVNQFVAISSFIGARIRCFYQRRSKVIYPPVDTKWISDKIATREVRAKRGEAFLCAGALVPYKKIDAVVEAFNRNGEQLWIIGTGPCEKELRKIAAANIHFFGYVPDSELADRYRRCRALIFPGIEDFGMIPIECMAAGRPIIGFDGGGLRESINGVRYWRPEQRDLRGKAGVFIRDNSKVPLSDSVYEAVRFFVDNESEFTEVSCKEQARSFSTLRFFESWHELALECKIDPGLSGDIIYKLKVGSERARSVDNLAR